MPDDHAEYRLAPKARDDMEAVWLHSIDRWGLQQANRYIGELVEAFTLLAHSPMTGNACDHIRRGYRRHPVVRHVVHYRITDYGIAIIRVLHDRMLPTRHL